MGEMIRQRMAGRRERRARELQRSIWALSYRMTDSTSLKDAKPSRMGCWTLIGSWRRMAKKKAFGNILDTFKLLGLKDNSGKICNSSIRLKWMLENHKLKVNEMKKAHPENFPDQ